MNLVENICKNIIKFHNLLLYVMAIKIDTPKYWGILWGERSMGREGEKVEGIWENLASKNLVRVILP